ncbi:hypothetical protein [Brevundimonas diminuta]|uniref:hypothetical protein n=1 Tax=Brevundimonas diminuta TaxID=293 RepID=UPI001F595187|nr:hypothetical protein [Brevundimonas diminuta]
MFEDMNVGEEEARDQRDASRKASDEWLSRILLAMLAGNGAGLIALANAETIVQGNVWHKVIGAAIALSLLYGIATAFLGLVSRRHHHLVRELAYAKRLHQIKTQGRLTEAGEYNFMTLQSEEVRQTAKTADEAGLATDRYLIHALRGTVVAIGIMMITLILTPERVDPNRPQPATIPAKSEDTPAKR